MGLYYHDAVMACLQGFNQGEAASVWGEFDHKVVDRLTRCLTIHPGYAHRFIDVVT